MDLLQTFNYLIIKYGGIEATIRLIEAEQKIVFEPPKPTFIWGFTKYERQKARYIQNLIK